MEGERLICEVALLPGAGMTDAPGVGAATADDGKGAIC
jgi:hypothetical protein